MASIVIRDIDQKVLNVINDLAKKQGLTREEYLRRKLKELALLEYEAERIDQYKNLVEYVTNVIEQNTNVLNRIERSLNEK